jgi:hypothetical protein
MPLCNNLHIDSRVTAQHNSVPDAFLRVTFDESCDTEDAQEPTIPPISATGLLVGNDPK